MKVREVTTTPVISVGQNTPVVDIAALFERHKIKRIPVVAFG